VIIDVGIISLLAVLEKKINAPIEAMIRNIRILIRIVAKVILLEGVPCEISFSGGLFRNILSLRL